MAMSQTLSLGAEYDLATRDYIVLVSSACITSVKELLYAVIINIYYCTSGRAVQENIRFKAGSIGPIVGRTNTEAENRISSCTARPKECNNILYLLYDLALASSINGLGGRGGGGDINYSYTMVM